jgi:peroxiredoxin Q/BCP
MNLSSLLDSPYPTTSGPRTLREILAPDRPTVFVSYPMDFTAVCTKQLCSYRDDWSRLSALPVRWWGINRASPEMHARFKSEKSLPFDLITDPDGRLLSALNLKGLLWTRRGFAIVSPSGDLLASTAFNPFRFPPTSGLLQFLPPHLS